VKEEVIKGALPRPSGDQNYSLTYTEEFDEVLVQLPHAPGRTARMSKADFKKWFWK